MKKLLDWRPFSAPARDASRERVKRSDAEAARRVAAGTAAIGTRVLG